MGRWNDQFCNFWIKLLRMNVTQSEQKMCKCTTIPFYPAAGETPTTVQNSTNDDNKQKKKYIGPLIYLCFAISITAPHFLLFKNPKLVQQAFSVSIIQVVPKAGGHPSNSTSMVNTCWNKYFSFQLLLLAEHGTFIP